MQLVHNWYPADCCSLKDCKPIPCDQIIETAKGYLYNGLEFTEAMVRPSLDSLCHVCINIYNTPMCLFIQMSS